MKRETTEGSPPLLLELPSWLSEVGARPGGSGTDIRRRGANGVRLPCACAEEDGVAEAEESVAAALSEAALSDKFGGGSGKLWRCGTTSGDSVSAVHRFGSEGMETDRFGGASSVAEADSALLPACLRLAVRAGRSVASHSISLDSDRVARLLGRFSSAAVGVVCSSSCCEYLLARSLCRSGAEDEAVDISSSLSVALALLACDTAPLECEEFRLSVDMRDDMLAESACCSCCSCCDAVEGCAARCDRWRRPRIPRRA